VTVVRAFVAIDTSPVIDQLKSIQDVLRRGPGGASVRWKNVSGIHLTLKFLGSVQASMLADVYGAVSTACDAIHAFELKVGSLGCFPNMRRPRVVWLGVRDPRDCLAALQQHVETELVQTGHEPDLRPFRAHLTLGRVHRSASVAEIEALGRCVAETDVGAGASLLVDAVHVMRSDLRPSGAVYTELYRAPLARSQEQALSQQT